MPLDDRVGERPQSRETSTCPTGSTGRASAAFDSGTNRAASTMAITPNGQVHPEHRAPAEASRQRTTDHRPERQAMPATAPQTPMARARALGSGNVLVMIESATGLSMDPPRAWRARNAIRPPMRGDAAQQRAEGKSDHADLEDAPPTKAVRHGTRQNREAGDDKRVGVDHPLQADDGGTQVVLGWTAAPR